MNEPCSLDIGDCDGQWHYCSECGGDGWIEGDD